MNLKQYLQARSARAMAVRPTRETCVRCRKPRKTCYCALVRPFVSNPQFAILIHRDEARRGVATGRMSHLCLANSYLFEGTDFSDHPGVNALLADPTLQPVLMYPTAQAVNLTDVAIERRRAVFLAKRPLFFLIDSTWGQARRILRLSRNLHRLPTYCFTPPRPSRFLVRKQPGVNCFSTIESIHHVIELFNGEGPGQHSQLLDVFAHMVNQQIEYGHRKLIRRRDRALLGDKRI